MSIGEGWRNRVKLFGVESLNEVDRWRYDMDRMEQERVKARQQREQEQERREQDLARASTTDQIVALRAELSELREEHESLSRTMVDTMNATSDVFRTLTDERREQCAQIEDLKLAIAKLGASPEAKRVAFQFAREKDGGAEVVDLPNFLLRRTVN